MQHLLSSSLFSRCLNTGSHCSLLSAHKSPVSFPWDEFTLQPAGVCDLWNTSGDMLPIADCTSSTLSALFLSWQSAFLPTWVCLFLIAWWIAGTTDEGKQRSNLQKTLRRFKCIVPVLKMNFCLVLFLPQSCVAWLEVRLSCTSVPVLFPIAVIMGLFAEDCAGSKGSMARLACFR